MKLVSEQEEIALTEHLSSLFRIMDVADNPQPGFLSYDEVEEVLKKLDVQLTDAELKMLLPEEDANENELVDYHKFLPQAAKLLVTIKASKLALASEHRKEVMAEEKAKRMINTTLRELNASIRYIVSKVPEVHHETADHAARVRLMRHHVAHKSSGFSPTEIRIINRKYFTVPGAKKLSRSVKELMNDPEKSGRIKVEHHAHQHDSFSIDMEPPSDGLNKNNSNRMESVSESSIMKSPSDERRTQRGSLGAGFGSVYGSFGPTAGAEKTSTRSNAFDEKDRERVVRGSGDRSPTDNNSLSKRSDGLSVPGSSKSQSEDRRTQRGSMGAGFGSSYGSNMLTDGRSPSAIPPGSNARFDERVMRSSGDRTPNRTPRDAGGGGSSNRSNTPSAKAEMMATRGSRGSLGGRTPRSGSATPRDADGTSSSMDSMRALNPVAADAMNQLAALEMLLSTARDTVNNSFIVPTHSQTVQHTHSYLLQLTLL